MNSEEYVIRKITIGKEIIGDSMSYELKQKVYGGHVVVAIEEYKEKYIIFIEKEGEIKPWKSFNKNMGVGVEYNLDY